MSATPAPSAVSTVVATSAVPAFTKGFAEGHTEARGASDDDVDVDVGGDGDGGGGDISVREVATVHATHEGVARAVASTAIAAALGSVRREVDEWESEPAAANA